MNTLEIKYENKIKDWKDFKKYANKQFLEYEKLEGHNWKDYDFSIDCSEDQLLFKDMLQIRCIEELTEASIAFKDKEEEHFLEEITDSFNFLISAYIMADLPWFTYKRELNNEFIPSRVNKLENSDLHYMFYLIVEKIGYLCNLLKNRPWAQSNYLVSMLDFEERAKDLWETFFWMLTKIGLSDKKLFELFERKYEVNKWRIKTGY